MKVLQVIDLGFEAGGAEKLVRIIRDGMQSLGHEVFVLSTDRNPAGRSLFSDATVPAVSGRALTRLRKYLWNHEAYRAVRSAIRDFNPDIVHLHTICEFSPAVLWGIGHRPALLTVHGPEEFTLNLLPWLLPPTDYRHRSYRREDIRPVGRLRYSYLRHLQRPAYLLALKRVKLVTVPSKFMASTVSRDFPHTPIKVLYPGTIIPREVSERGSRRPLVLFVGRLERIKGVDWLINAFAEVARDRPESRLRIVGDGHERRALEEMTKELGLTEGVEFTGWLEADELRQEYADASVVVIPSVCPECFPLVGLEALASGRAIIGSNVGGIPELIDPEKTGLIVEPGDISGLAQAIDSLLFDDQRLATAAQRCSVKARDFSMNSFIERQLEAYSHVLGHAESSGA